MGWGRFLLLGDLGQQLDLGDQKTEIDRQTAEIARLRDEMRGNRGPAPETSREVWQLRNENDELKLYLTALIRILVSKNIVTPDELNRFVEVIDAEDGSADGRFDGKIV